MDALGAEQVLDAERNAFQRATFAFRQPGIRRRGHRARLVMSDGDIGIKPRIGGIDRRQIGIREFAGVYCLRPQLFARFANREFCQIAHEIFFS
jgi:hypothetical protein